MINGFEIIRIEEGCPALERELTEEHNPWEAGLDRAIHLDKGCYLGQEVIARLETYDKSEAAAGRAADERCRSNRRILPVSLKGWTKCRENNFLRPVPDPGFTNCPRLRPQQVLRSRYRTGPGRR